MAPAGPVRRFEPKASVAARRTDVGLPAKRSRPPC